jgi:LuxR family maltose regulon positive regulatory protein
MPTPLLEVKFYIPPAGAKSVRRPRLIRRLDEGRHRKLTLISAPAGFGKTTLLSDWVGQSERPIAWLSLDEDDNGPARFWIYLVAALQTLDPALGEPTRAALQSPQPPPLESLLTTLINEIGAAHDQLTLILDDYHVITAKPIHDGLAYLLEYLPPQLRLVVASRTDPPLPLHLLRARQQLTELRAADLRFTSGEAAAFLNQAMGLDLSPELVDVLERRTEGWITGLQLAALSMEGRDDVSGFVKTFAGSHRYVLDYLAEEVIRQQSDAVQTFLLRTSILSRMTASLCDAVTGQRDGFETLAALEQANLFVVPLDDQRRWYRYHHLFAQVLRAFLQRTATRGSIASLHTRAAQWYEAHGEAHEAFKHAVAAGDFERAARLIEENWLRVGHTGRIRRILRWLESMPEGVLRARPVLSLAYAWILWLTGQLDGVETHLDAAAAAWKRLEAAGALDPERARWKTGALALRIQLALYRGQLEEAVHLARETLSLAAGDDALGRGYGHLGLAHAYRELGDYEAACSSYVEGISMMRTAGNASSASLAAFYLCRLLQHQGRPQRAMVVVQEAMAFMDARGAAESPAYGVLHVALASLLCERGQLQAAEDHLLRGLNLSQVGGHHSSLRNAALVRARLRLAQGDAPGALEAIHDAELLTPGAEMPLPSAQLAAHKARIWLAQGNLSAAARWADEAARRPGQDSGYTRQIEATVCARVLLAQGKLEEARVQLAASRQLAEERGSRGWAVEIGILSALAEESRGNRVEALLHLRRALTQAEPERYVQRFVDEGPPMATLLAAIRSAQRGADRSESPGISPESVQQLLDALGRKAADQEPAAGPGPSPLVEPLTSREEEVLRLMAAGLSNREIAEELIVAVGTVKAHLHHIYGKLGVGRRTEAAARARELQLL